MRENVKIMMLSLGRIKFVEIVIGSFSFSCFHFQCTAATGITRHWCSEMPLIFGWLSLKQ